MSMIEEERLPVRRRLWEWFIISVSNQSVISVCFRNRKYSRKEVDGTERYSTLERAYHCVFYSIMLLAVYLTFGMGIAAINANCEMGTAAFSDCHRGLPANSTSCLRGEEGDTPLTKDHWYVPRSKPFTIGSKHYKFRFNQLKPRWYYTYTNQYNGSEPLYQSAFDNHASSFICTIDTKDPDKLYCLHPGVLCNTYSNPPAKYDPKSITKFAVLQVVTTLLTQIAIWVVVSPLSTLLVIVFVGFCEPEKGHWARKFYKMGIATIVLVFTSLAIVCAFFALFLTFYFFSNVKSGTRWATIGTSLLFWALSLTVFDFLSAAIGAIFSYPKLICCGIPLGVEIRKPQDEEQGLEMKRDKIMESRHQVVHAIDE